MISSIGNNLRLLSRRLDFWVAVAAGVAYSSWPLGFWLNPFVAHRYFASQLEAPHEPYSGVFVALDIISGGLMLICGILQWRKAKNRVSLRLAIVAYALFGALVIAAAVAPDSCQGAQQACQALLHSPAMIIHGISSIISVVFLFLSLALPAKILLEQRMYHWLVLLAVFVGVGWGVTGIGTAIVMAHGMRSNWLQYDLISVCSLTAVICVAMVDRLGAYSKVQHQTSSVDQDP